MKYAIYGCLVPVAGCSVSDFLVGENDNYIALMPIPDAQSMYARDVFDEDK